MKKILVLFITIFVLVSCNNTKDSNEITKVNDDKTKIEKIQITTSIIPLTSITNYIGGEHVKVKSLVPAWITPHVFDLKANQMIDLEKSDLIVYLGLDHIDWFLNKAIENKNNVLSVNNGIELLESDEHEHDEHEDDEHHEEGEHKDEHYDEHEDDEHSEKAHSVDPHIWSNSENAYIIAKSILDRLSTISPENKGYFETNLESFKNELEIVKKDFKEKTRDKKQNNFIVFHDAYNYLFKEFDIDNSKKHIFRKNILNDPNSNEIKELIDEIQEKEIKIAFKEPQLDSNNLKRISSEYSLEVYILDRLWADESSNWYIDNYKNNLKSLEKIYE